MIRYALKCGQGHEFDSWFQSADAYEKLASAGMVACSVCGDTQVDKMIMAPRIRPARNAATPTPEPQPETPLSAPASEAQQVMAQVKAYVEANTEDVGQNFVKEARAMHDGDAPERAIRGEAKPEDARALLDDGVPIVPLPFSSGRKVN